MDSLSSPLSLLQRNGCFLCSPKSVSKKKSKKSLILGDDLDLLVKNDEFLSDLKFFLC